MASLKALLEQAQAGQGVSLMVDYVKHLKDASQADVELLIEAISNHEKLEEVAFNRFDWNNPVCLAFLRSPRCLCSLRLDRLSFANSSVFTLDACHAIHDLMLRSSARLWAFMDVEEFADFTSICKLWVHDNKDEMIVDVRFRVVLYSVTLSEGDLRKLSECLGSPMCRLTELGMASCRIKSDNGDDEDNRLECSPWSVMQDALRRNESLTSILMGSLDRGGMEYILRGLILKCERHQHLNKRNIGKVHFGFNSFNGEHCRMLAQLLQCNKDMHVLDLTSCIFETKEGLTCVLNALKCNTSITCVMLNHCEMLKECIVAWVDVIRHNQCLKELSFVSCRLNHEQMSHIVAALIQNNHIHELKMEHNFVDTEDGKKGPVISNLLEKNNTLKTLSVGSVPFSLEDCIVIVNSLKQNASLTQIDLKDMKCVKSNEVVAAMQEVFKTNGSLTSCIGFPTEIGALCETNKTMHQEATKSVLALLSVRRLRRTWFDMVPREVVQMIALCLLKTKVELNVWRRM